MSKTKVTIFRHMAHEGLGSLHGTLLERGCEISHYTVSRTCLKDLDALEPDLLLVMGGPIGVHQADYYPFLYEEIRIIKERIAADKPTIGVCLGAQLVAKALGANVYPGEHKECGWYPLTMSDTAKGTVFEHLAPEKTNMFHWHGDTFDLPEGATLMASSEKYKHQIYTYGENILGMQCHPEVTAESLLEWYVALVGDVLGDRVVMPLEQLRKETQKYAETLEIQSNKLLNQWLDERGL